MVWLASRASWGKKGVRHHPMDMCLNCEEKLSEGQYFCHHCGQKVHNSKLTFGSLIAEFFSGIFNLENNIYRTLKCLPIPGYLSKKFMSGQRKKYVNPIRLYLVALVIHIAVLGNIMPISRVSRATARSLSNLGQQELKSNYLKVKSELDPMCSDGLLDSLEHRVFDVVNSSQDSVIFTTFSDTLTKADFNIPYLQKRYSIYRMDLFGLEEAAFLEKYPPANYPERIGMLQVLRTVRDPAGAIRFAMGNLIWSVSTTIILIGLLMKLLYIRKSRYYVEHLIVLFNIHSFAFLIASIDVYFFSTIEEKSFQLGGVSYLVIAIFFFLSLKVYYGQGWIKTFIKYVMIISIYLVLLVSMIALVTILSLFLFK